MCTQIVTEMAGQWTDRQTNIQIQRDIERDICTDKQIHWQADRWGRDGQTDR